MWVFFINTICVKCFRLSMLTSRVEIIENWLEVETRDKTEWEKYERKLCNSIKEETERNSKKKNSHFKVYVSNISTSTSNTGNILSYY